LVRKQPKIIVIVGPTSSGKSELAVKIAKKVKGEIISADSRQIYKNLDIGTGKITRREMKNIPHHLLDIVSPKKNFTVVDYQKLALKKIKDIWQKGKIPIICGGTGFYIQAVIDGIVLPNITPNPNLRKKLEKLETNKLFDLLKKKDPKRAKNIDAFNRRRLIRALEIVYALGKVPPLKRKPLSAKILFIGLKKPKDELEKRIEKRIKQWLKRGLLKEIEKLLKMKLSQKRFKELGLVYVWAFKLYQKEISRQEFINGLKKELLNYAKRQMTWFKKDKRIIWIKNESEIDKLLKNFL